MTPQNERLFRRGSVIALHSHNTRLPLYVRVALYASDHDGELLQRGQLRQDLGTQLLPSDISRAIRTGIKVGLLQPTSHARCLSIVRPPT